MSKRIVCCAFGVMALVAAPALGVNLLSNPDFTGTGGAVVGAVTGDVPDDWRAFGVGDRQGVIEVIPLPADALEPGSPPTNSVKWDVVVGGGGDAGFDNDNGKFAVTPGNEYHLEFWVKTGNSDGSDQGMRWGFPLFNPGYLGREPGGGSTVATSAWQKVIGPTWTDGEATIAHVSFRPDLDDGENAIVIAAPTVVPEPASALLLLTGGLLALRRRR